MSVPNTHYGAAEAGRMLAGCRSFYFIGIGGINVSSLALLTKRRGFAVSGSDRQSTALTEHLRASGIRVFDTHDASHLDEVHADAVVYTVAIQNDNPEYLEALRRGLPVLSRADYMGYLMSAYPRRIGISGMHGKSSTTSMCAEILMDAGVDPTVLSGAEMRAMDGSTRIGDGEDFLFEACEYMDSFLDFSPNIAVLLNIEMDHVDYFHDMEQIRTSFGRFASLTGEDGFAVVNADDENVMSAVSGYRGHLVTFGRTENADYTAANLTAERGRAAFDILKSGSFFCRAALRVPGEFQILNALAAAAACDLCRISPEKIGAGLSAFPGALRRMEHKGILHGADVYDDYGHHPTEVRATLRGAGEMGFERLFCVFQSHTYSRTRGLWDEFLTAFSPCTHLLIAPIYAARETDTLGVTPEKLAAAINEKEGRIFAGAPGDLSRIAGYLNRELRPGDGLIVMGAGDIYRLFDLLEFD